MSVILNVSGRQFEVSKEILSKSQLFNGLLTDCQIDRTITIDRSPKLFEHVLAYLVNDKYPYPRKYYSELDYYLVVYDIKKLYDPVAIEIERMNQNILHLTDQQNSMSREIYSLHRKIAMSTCEKDVSDCNKNKCGNNSK